MKKYSTLAELLIDYRSHNNLSQLDMASMLDVDIRTVLRWEKNESLIKSEKEKDFVENLGIPHQVIRNLNTDKPISIYFDLKKRTYSFSGISRNVPEASWFNTDMEINTDRIQLISNDSDIKFITDIQEINKNTSPIKADLVKLAAKVLPDLNLVLRDHAGFYAGHISILPLKYDTYLKLREQQLKESDLMISDLATSFTEKPLVFYYYSLYADTMDNAYYLMNSLLSHFKRNKYKEYIFAGISYRAPKIEMLRQMGLKIIWEEAIEEEGDNISTFMEGNLDMFLFGKMS